MRLARPIDLLFISKSPKAKLDMFKAGISLETRTVYSLAELVDKATNDRLILGREGFGNPSAAAVSRTDISSTARIMKADW